MQAAYVDSGLSSLCPGGESTTRWVCRVSKILHSSDRINADIAIITLEGNFRFEPLKLKLGRLKRHCNDMGTLMAALVKHADSDNTKDPESDDDKTGKGKKSSNSRGRQHNTAGHGNGGKRKTDNSMDFVANTNAQDKGQRRKGKPPDRSGAPNPNPDRLTYLLNQPCPKHGTKEMPANHLWKDCYIMQEFKNSNAFRYDHGSGGGSASGSHGPGHDGGNSSSGFNNNQGDTTIKVTRAARVATISSSSNRVIRATRSS